MLSLTETTSYYIKALTTALCVKYENAVIEYCVKQTVESLTTAQKSRFDAAMAILTTRGALND